MNDNEQNPLSPSESPVLLPQESQTPPPLPPTPPQMPPPPAPTPPVSPGPLGPAVRPHRAGLILAFGVTSLVINVGTLCGGIITNGLGCCGGVIPIALAVPAWMMANNDLRLMSGGLMDPSGRSGTSAGKSCAIISLIISLLAIGVGLFFLLAAMGLIAVAGIAGSR